MDPSAFPELFMFIGCFHPQMMVKIHSCRSLDHPGIPFFSKSLHYKFESRLVAFWSQLVATNLHWALFGPLFMSFGTVPPNTVVEKGKEKTGIFLANLRLGLEHTTELCVRSVCVQNRQVWELRIRLATRAAIYRSLWALWARNRAKKKLQKGLLGGLQKSPKKYPKKSKNTDFRTFLGIFWFFLVFFGDFPADPRKTFFWDFFVISARRARRLLSMAVQVAEDKTPSAPQTLPNGWERFPTISYDCSSDQ